MSIKNNTTSLQEVLEILNTKAAGGGTVVDDVSRAIIEGTITSVADNNIKSIGAYAFNHYEGLTSISFPACTTIGTSAFGDCHGLTIISFPVCTAIGAYAFEDCTNLTAISFPVCTNIRTYAFTDCNSLTTVSFPACTTIGDNAFSYCRGLTTANFPVCTSIGSYAFNSCRTLSSLQLGASSVCVLTNSNVFNTTPFAGYSAYFSGTPHIYVPARLITDYQNATNWAYFSKYFVPMGNFLSSINNQVMIFNAIKSISTTISFKDDSGNKITPTVTITSADESIVNVSNIQITSEQISFDVMSNNITGEANIIVTATYAEETLTEMFVVKVFETLSEPLYTIESLNTTHTFVLNSNNYYESNNKGEDDSFAVCKVNIDTFIDCTMHLDCINYAENNWDYGLLSNLDSTLALSSDADAHNVYKSFKGLSGADIQTISYEVPKGQHYIYVKYIKDSSGANGNDSFQFKVRFEY